MLRAINRGGNCHVESLSFALFSHLMALSSLLYKEAAKYYLLGDAVSAQSLPYRSSKTKTALALQEN